MKKALLWEPVDGGKVRCFLCNHRCIIAPGKRGICMVRENRDGTLYSLVYGKLIAANNDPIEKKPLFHFLPGTKSMSIATVGCNFSCLHCQNHDISQMPREKGVIYGEDYSPEDVVDAALRLGSRSISYTYTEPTVYFEFALDCSRLAKEKGLCNVFVTNGYMTKEAIELISPYLDAANVDLKGSDEFYRKICGARQKGVLESIEEMVKRGIWVEVTTLIIPGINDGEKELRDIVSFIRSLSPSIPWHVTAFYPTYKLTTPRPASYSDLKRAYEIGKREGLRYVYMGNVWGAEEENTYCPSCGELLIERSGYSVRIKGLEKGRCRSCGEEIEGVWGI